MKTYNWTIFPDANAETKAGLSQGTPKSGPLSDFLIDIQKYAWSPFVFKHNYRNSDNWLSCDFLAADYDLGTPNLVDTIKKLTPFRHLIGTTKSHQKAKEGKPAVDRFRAILPLEDSITTREEYKRLWERYSLFLPGLDTKCKDLARFYWPIAQTASVDEFAPAIQISNLPLLPRKFISVSKIFFKERKKQSVGSLFPAPQLSKGRISNRTSTFLSEGAPKHQWHDEFRFAAKDLKAQNYSEQEAKDLLKGVTGKLTKDDEFQLEYAYHNDSYPFKYRPQEGV